METETKIEINIKKIKDTYCLTFVENPIYFSLMRSVKNMLDTSICTQIKNNLIIKAKKVQYYSDFLSEESLNHGSNKLSHTWCLRIAYCLSKQIEYLVSNESKCFYKLDYHHLMVIDDCFFYLSPNALIPLEEEKMHIYSYSLKDGFFSPEFVQNNLLIPISVHYKTIYYSLGLLLVSALKDDNNVYNDCSVQNLQNPLEKINYPLEKINYPLEKINGTKLYFFIVRCLQKEIHDRYLIFL
jgi:hypothetical protein